MLWFERPFLAILRHEYAQAMRFTEDEAAEVMPSAPAGAVPALRARAVLRSAVPVLLVSPGPLQRVEDGPLLRGAAPRDPPLPRPGLPLQRRLRRWRARRRWSADELIATLELVRSLSPVRAVSDRDEPESPAAGRPATLSRRGRHAPFGGSARASTTACSRPGLSRSMRQRRGRSANASPRCRASSRRSTST